MKRFTRILAMLLVLCLAVLSVTACNNTGDDTSKTASGSAGTEGGLFSKLPQRDYEEREINFLVPGDWREIYKSVEILEHETSPDIINTAIKNRNEIVEGRFNVKITETRTDSSQTMIQRIRSATLSSLPDYDIVMPAIPDAAMLALENSFYLLNDMEYVDLENPCWDKNAIDSLSINHKNYFVTGDISLLTLGCTHAIVFNKDIVNEQHLEDPYELVETGKWTIDKLQEMARKVTNDSDGEPGMSYKDTYGFLINSNFVTSMYVGSGHTLTGKDDEDKPVISIMKDTVTAANIFTKIFDLVNDETATGQIDNEAGNYAVTAGQANKNIWTAANESVAEKKALFRAMAIIDIPEIGKMEANYGVIPVPKFNQQQENYHSLVSTILATSCAIPVSAEDPEMSSIIMQAMCEASTETTKYAYVQTILKDRHSKDDKTEKMLDMIFANRVYDLGIVYNWGGESVWDKNSLSNFMNTVAFSGTQTFASTLDSISSVVQTDLEETLEQFNKKKN